MKRWLIASLCLISVIALGKAPAPAFPQYQIGFLIGPGINYYNPHQSYFTIKHADHASFAWNAHGSILFNRYLGVELGYTNFGFYENFGRGQSICDTTGQCGYSAANPIGGIFNSFLDINNDILVQSVYLAPVFQYPINNASTLFLKAGVAYTHADINSHITIHPTIIGIGPVINTTDKIKNHQYIQPYLGLGWHYQITQHLALAWEFDWNGVVKMYRQNGDYDGSLYPMVIFFGTEYRF